MGKSEAKQIGLGDWNSYEKSDTSFILNNYSNNYIIFPQFSKPKNYKDMQ